MAGATGLVGRELCAWLAASDEYGAVHVLARRTPPALVSTPKLTVELVDFDALPSLPATDDVYVALGTTIRVVGSEEAFRRVDHAYVVAVARAARAAGARRIGVVSALGADAKSSVFLQSREG